MSLLKVHPISNCDICCEVKILINCNNNLCDWKMCKKCLKKYNNNKCPACRKENSFHLRISKCEKNINLIKEFFYYFINNLKNKLNEILQFYKYVYNIFRNIIRGEMKFPVIFYLFIIFCGLLIAGHTISDIIFLKNNNNNQNLFEIILYTFIGFIFIFIFIAMITA